MELVYLWVEEYKNIHKQGFNFSPRFTCNYDGKELTIKENDDYIENFFGENINITAIVGKNGSGKSSLLKVIRQIIDSQIKDGSFLIFYDKEKKQYICIYTLTEINSRNIEMIQENIMDSHIQFPLFDYSLTYDSSINFQNPKLPVYPNKSNGLLSFSQELAINQKNIMQNHHFLKVKNQLNKFENFFEVSEILISVDLSTFSPDRDKKLKPTKKNTYDELLRTVKNSPKIMESLSSIYELYDLLIDKTSYIQPRTEEAKYNFNINQEMLGDFHGDIDSNLNIRDNFGEIENIFLNKNKIRIIEKKDNTNSIYNVLKFNMDDLKEETINYIIGSFSSKHFQIDIIDINGKKLSDLSFGEQQLLFILNKIYTLGIKPDKDLYDDIDPQEINIDEIPRYYKINYIILFDEIDIGFHPDWQKRTIQYIIDFLNSTDVGKYYHLIFTTHSPFLLSDIPKENIIFLNNKQSIKQTFGANIHTLLSDSFFMEDGLMGEFAKGKINEIIDFHKLVEKNRHKDCLTKIYLHSKQKKFWQTQKIIGEEYLKQVIKNHLVEIEKKLLGKDRAKQEEIKRVEAYLESLKK